MLLLLGANWEHWGCSWRGGWDGGASSKLRPSTPPGAALGGKASLSPLQEHQGGDSHPCCPQHGAGHTQGCPTAAPILPRVAGSGSVTFIVSPPWGWLCPHFLASPTPSTELDAHSCCWPSPKCGSALWVSPCPPTACTPVEHPRHGGSTLAERGQLAAPPRAAFVRSLWAS